MYIQAKVNLPIYIIKNIAEHDVNSLHWNIDNKNYPSFDTLLAGQRYPVSVEKTITDNYGQQWFIFDPLKDNSRVCIPATNEQVEIKVYTTAQEVAIKKDEQPNFLDKFLSVGKDTTKTLIIVAAIAAVVYFLGKEAILKSAK